MELFIEVRFILLLFCIEIFILFLNKGSIQCYLNIHSYQRIIRKVGNHICYFIYFLTITWINRLSFWWYLEICVKSIKLIYKSINKLKNGSIIYRVLNK